MSSITNEFDNESSQIDATKNFQMTEISAHPQDKTLSPAAKRALHEAELRRKQIDERCAAHSKEVNGRGGLDPVRFEDWEIKGLAVDF